MLARASSYVLAVDVCDRFVVLVGQLLHHYALVLWQCAELVADAALNGEQLILAGTVLGYHRGCAGSMSLKLNVSSDILPTLPI